MKSKRVNPNVLKLYMLVCQKFIINANMGRNFEKLYTLKFRMHTSIVIIRFVILEKVMHIIIKF